MIICQVDARTPGMTREVVEQELQVMSDVLATIGGELIDADVNMRYGCIAVYVRVESELVASDIFDASHLAIERVSYLGPYHEAYSDLERTIQFMKPVIASQRYVRAALSPSLACFA